MAVSYDRLWKLLIDRKMSNRVLPKNKKGLKRLFNVEI
jgi:hypothetical protein